MIPLAAAVDAAQAAAHLIRYRAAGLDEAAFEEKAHNDLVTEVDQEAERVITERLQKTFPDVPILGEETAGLETLRDLRAAAAPETPRWIVDPIDGTTNFVHAMPVFSVSIALQDAEGMAVAVVLDVAREELFTAVRGEGAFLNGAPIHVSRRARLQQALLATGFPFRNPKIFDRYLEVFRPLLETTQGIRRTGSAALDLAYVACGRYDGYFETAVWPWDVAAGLLLVEEAGGRVTDYGGEPEHVAFGRQLLATNGRLHAAALEVVAPMADVRE